jgi:hypothetical protein
MFHPTFKVKLKHMMLRRACTRKIPQRGTNLLVWSLFEKLHTKLYSVGGLCMCMDHSDQPSMFHHKCLCPKINISID